MFKVEGNDGRMDAYKEVTLCICMYVCMGYAMYVIGVCMYV